MFIWIGYMWNRIHWTTTLIKILRYILLCAFFQILSSESLALICNSADIFKRERWGERYVQRLRWLYMWWCYLHTEEVSMSALIHAAVSVISLCEESTTAWCLILVPHLLPPACLHIKAPSKGPACSPQPHWILDDCRASILKFSSNSIQFYLFFLLLTYSICMIQKRPQSSFLTPVLKLTLMLHWIHTPVTLDQIKILWIHII